MAFRPQGRILWLDTFRIRQAPGTPRWTFVVLYKVVKANQTPPTHHVSLSTARKCFPQPRGWLVVRDA